MDNRRLPMKKRDMAFIALSIAVLAYVAHHNFFTAQEADGLLKAPTAQNGEYIWDDAIIDGILTYSVLDGNDMMFKKMVDSALNEWEEKLDGELVFEEFKYGYTDITFDEVKTLGKTKMYGFKQDLGGRTTLKGHPDMGVITQANVMVVANSKNEVQEFTVVKHEIGHALGLFEHSDDDESVMYRSADNYMDQEVKQCDADLILEINYLADYNDNYGASLEQEGCYNNN